jgi:lysophospholipase L1-like esterase
LATVVNVLKNTLLRIQGNGTSFLSYRSKIFILIYFSLVHCLLIALVFGPSLYIKVSLKLNNGLAGKFGEHARASIVTMHARQEANTSYNSVYFIGDSMVQGFNTSRLSLPTINLGIGHDRISHVAARLKTYQNVKSSKSLLISVGVNDLRSKSVAESISDYEKLISQNHKVSNILVLGVLPIDSKLLGLHLNRKVSTFNHKLQVIASMYANVNYVKPPTKLYSNSKDLIAKFHIGDGLHLNSAGYEVWIHDLQGTLNDLIEG